MERLLMQVVRVGDCLMWAGGRTHDGYAQAFHGHGRTRYVHRYLYEELIGPIPAGRELDHLCRNRGCVNVLHLEAVTRRENLMRGDTLPAQHAAKTHCLRGHEFTPENVWRSPSKSGRWCRACFRLRAASYRRKA